MTHNHRVTCWTATDGQHSVGWHVHPDFLDIAIGDVWPLIAEAPKANARNFAKDALAQAFNLSSSVGCRLGYLIAGFSQWLAVTALHGNALENAKFRSIRVLLRTGLGGGHRFEAIVGEKSDGETVIIEGNGTEIMATAS